MLFEVRGAYSYYANRPIPNLESDEELLRFWESTEVPLVLVENERASELQALLPDGALEETTQIGSRTASVYSRATTPPP